MVRKATFVFKFYIYRVFGEGEGLYLLLGGGN